MKRRDFGLLLTGFAAGFMLAWAIWDFTEPPPANPPVCGFMSKHTRAVEGGYCKRAP